MSVQFTSNHNDEDWVLTNVYGPCHLDGKESLLLGSKILRWQMILTGQLWETLI
jgi:hypothetical protein